MQETSPPDILHWSSAAVPESLRFDYFVHALSSALIPMHAARRSDDAFALEMSVLDLGELAIVRQSGSAHRSYRDKRDIERSGDRTFHLIVNLDQPIDLDHHNRVRLQAGDSVLVDSNYRYDFDIASSFEVVHVKFNESWMRRWLPDPSRLVGRRLASDEGWGSALSAFASLLSPQAIIESPLPAAVLADQVGGLLKLVAREHGDPVPVVQADAALRQRVYDCVAQRLHERDLTAETVAATLNVPANVMHDRLAAAGQTFGDCLARARADVAVRMLTAPMLSDLSYAEIARRTGFADVRHLARVVRTRRGLDVRQLRGHRALHRPD